MAYVDHSTPGGTLCVADVTTEDRGCLIRAQDGIDLSSITWSPDGSMIAVNRWLYPNAVIDDFDLLVVSADGSATLPGGLMSPSVFSEDVPVLGAPMWSADSREVALFGDGAFVIVDVRDGSSRNVSFARGGLSATHVSWAWSPDGESFAFGALETDKAKVFKLDVASGDMTTLVSFEPNHVGAGTFNDMSWSPNGDRVLFTYAPPPPSAPWSGTRSQHWVVDADGSDAMMLYNSPRDDGPGMQARFSTVDGSLIAFDGYSGDVINIFVMNSDGTGVRQLTHSESGAYRPRWFPRADTHILYTESHGQGLSATMSIIGSGLLGGETGPPRHFFPGVSAEWTTVPGELPNDMFTPGTPPPAPATTETSQSASASTPTPTGNEASIPSGIVGPSAGTGEAPDSAAIGWRHLSAVLAVASSVLLATAVRVKRAGG